MTTTKSMSTTQADNFFIIESHAVENITQMLRITGVGTGGADIGIGETAIGGNGGRINFIDATAGPRNRRATQGFNGSDWSSRVTVVERE